MQGNFNPTSITEISHEPNFVFVILLCFVRPFTKGFVRFGFYCHFSPFSFLLHYPLLSFWGPIRKSHLSHSSFVISVYISIHICMYVYMHSNTRKSRINLLRFSWSTTPPRYFSLSINRKKKTCPTVYVWYVLLRARKRCVFECSD